MFPSLFLPLLSWSLLITEASILQLPGNSNQSSPAFDVTTLGSPELMKATWPVTRPSPNEWDFHCSAATYGRNLNVDGCLQAFRSMSTSPTQRIYRDRADTAAKDVRLPQMTISGKSLPLRARQG